MRNVFWQDPFSKKDSFGDWRYFSKVITHLESSSYSVIKWPFYDPPLAYLIRTDYTITAVNSIPSCGLLVASKFWRVVKKEKKRKRRKCSVTGKEWGRGRGEGWILSCFRRKGVKRLSHGRCHPCSVYVGSRIIGAPFNRLSVPHLSECLEKRVYVCDRDGGDGCFEGKGLEGGVEMHGI